MNRRNGRESAVAFAAGGVTGQLLHRIDWAAGPLGPVAAWPQSLLTALSILQHCPQPALLWWGPQLVQFYNDSCLPLLGDAHPTAMGQPAESGGWLATMPRLGAAVLEVLAAGQPRRPDAEPGQQTTPCDCMLVPVQGEQGSVGGVLWLPAAADDRSAVPSSPSLVPAAELNEALRRAQAAEERFLRLFESGMIGLMLTDYEGHVLDANDAFLDIVGYTREDVEQGRLRWDAMTPPEWRAISAQAVADMKASGTVRPFEKEYFRKDGTRVAVVIGSARVEAQQCNITFALDVSGRKRATQALRSLAEVSGIVSASLDYTETLSQVARTVVPHIADWCAVDVVEKTGIINRVAVAHADEDRAAEVRRMRQRYPVPADAPIGHRKVIRTGNPELYREITDDTLAAIAHDAEHLRLLRELGMHSAMVVPLAARGQILGAITLVSTKAGRRYDEEDLAVAQEIARRCALAADNARLYADATAAVRLRDEFLSIASHELKTPLTPLQLHIQALARSGAGLFKDAAAEQIFTQRLATLSKQATRLTRLVDELLDISRIVQGRLELILEQLDLAEVLQDVMRDFQLAEAAEQAGCRLETRIAPGLVGRWDRLRLEEVVVNLLSNAFKYGRGMPVSLTATRGNGEAVLTVTDQGIGIAPEDQARIFGRFERAASARHYGGLGLGLHIARQLVQAMGGTIAVRSEPGRGATFTVELPLAASESRTDTPSA